jgi:hypothetical protein
MTVNTPISPFPLYILYLFFLFYFFVRKKKIEKYNRKRSTKEYITHTPDNDNCACLSDILMVIDSPVFVIMFSEQGESVRGRATFKNCQFLSISFFPHAKLNFLEKIRRVSRAVNTKKAYSRIHLIHGNRRNLNSRCFYRRTEKGARGKR